MCPFYWFCGEVYSPFVIVIIILDTACRVTRVGFIHRVSKGLLSHLFGLYFIIFFWGLQAKFTNTWLVCQIASNADAIIAVREGMHRPYLKSLGYGNVTLSRLTTTGVGLSTGVRVVSGKDFEIITDFSYMYGKQYDLSIKTAGSSLLNVLAPVSLQESKRLYD